MSRAKGLILGAGAALSLGFAGGAFAQGQVSSDEVRAIVAETLADAETRSSLLQAGATAGHDGRFFIASPDGAFRLNVSGQSQFRYVMNFLDEGDDESIDEFQAGFQARRNRLDFTGNIINKDWTFRVQPAWDASSAGSIQLLDAWMQYNFGTGWKFRWGQFKLPLLREELVSSARQLAVERSVTNEVFTQGRSQGVELGFEQEDWRFLAAFSDGIRSANTDLDNPDTAELAFTGRFEYKFAGTWARFADFTSRQGDDFAALLGVAGHWQERKEPPRDRFVLYTADISLEGDGWNIFGAAVGNHVNFRNAGSLNNFGLVAQAGYRFAPDTELFGRWDAFFPDSDTDLSRDNYHFITVGLNQYYAGHAAKATVDVVWALNETVDIADFGGFGTSTGLLGSPEDNEFVIRLQFQFLF